MLIPRSIETQTLNMERDPETGRKLINQYLVSRLYLCFFQRDTKLTVLQGS